MEGTALDRALVVITSPPGSPDALRALAVVSIRGQQGHDVALALLQDAVQAAVRHNETPAAQVVSRLAGQGVAIYIAQQDLALHGVSPDDLVPGAVAVNDRQLVELMLADGTKTLGSF